jgi:hypothetical protein
MCTQVFLRPPRLMLRYLLGLNQASAAGLPGMPLHTGTVGLYAGMTFAMCAHNDETARMTALAALLPTP